MPRGPEGAASGVSFFFGGVFEYQTLFDARGELYNRANTLYPAARAEEARRILDHLGAGTLRWLDVSAGGGYLSDRARAEGFPEARCSCDASWLFLRVGPPPRMLCVCRSEELAFRGGAFDGAACLAALHHSEDPRSLVGELLRVTRAGGRAALGDVAAGSRAAEFLNGFVHLHTATGHRGRFYDPDRIGGFFSDAGGAAVRVEVAEISWHLPGREESLLYCRDLFGLRPETADAELSAALGALGAEPCAGGVRLPWTMLYASAQRR